MAEDESVTILFDRKNILGSGGFGHALLGTFNGEAVAVKRIEQHKRCLDREEKALNMLDHPNVMKLFGIMDTEDYRCYALELCAGSMDLLFLPDYDPKKYKGPPLPRHIKVLLQLAEGLAYIHSKGLVHRDIKPENVLISISEPVMLKWADFGLTKETDEGGTYEMSGQRGTLYWMAPEILEYIRPTGPSGPNRLFTTLTDVFSAGCLFFSFMTRGNHPFGNKLFTDVPSNIESNNPVNFLNTGILPNMHFCHDCLEKMLNSNCDERWPMSKVVSFLVEKMKTELVDLCSLQEPTDIQVDQLELLVYDPDCPDLNKKDENNFTPIEVLCKFNSSRKLKRCLEILLKTYIEKEDGSSNSLEQQHTVQSEPKKILYSLDGTMLLYHICGCYIHEDLLEIIQLLFKWCKIDFKQFEECEPSDKRNIFREFFVLKPETINFNLQELENVFEILIANGADVNANDEFGVSALHYLLQYSRPMGISSNTVIEITKLFIKKGLNIRTTDEDGKNLLHYLLQYYQPEGNEAVIMTHILIEYGIDVNSKDKEGSNALHYLLYHYIGTNGIDILRILIENGISIPDVKNEERRYIWNEVHYLGLLMMAYKGTDAVEIARILIENGNDVNTKDSIGRNALHYNCFQWNNSINKTEMIKLLFEKGIDVNAKDNNGRNALHCLFYKISNDRLNIAQMIMEDGRIDVNSTNVEGQTPLHFFFISNYENKEIGIEILKMLLDNGADTKARDNEGKDVLYYFDFYQSTNKLEISKLLQL